MRNMSKSVLHSKRIEAFQLVSIPAGVVIIISLLLLMAKDSNMSFSVLMGGLVWLGPNLYFAIKVFFGGGAKITPQSMLINFYRAEVTKLALCAIFFIIIVKYLPIAILPLLAGYSIAQVAFWIAPFLLYKAKRLVK